MSKSSATTNRDLASVVPLFAALGDETRLQILMRLSSGGQESITSLSSDSSITRQAVRKHLNVLALAGLVSDERHGREHLWQLEPQRLAEAGVYIDGVSRRWDEALDRLKNFVED